MPTCFRQTDGRANLSENQGRLCRISALGLASSSQPLQFPESFPDFTEKPEVCQRNEVVIFARGAAPLSRRRRRRNLGAILIGGRHLVLSDKTGPHDRDAASAIWRPRPLRRQGAANVRSASPHCLSEARTTTPAVCGVSASSESAGPAAKVTHDVA